jgi:succinylglutamic semialdehyde dehydrogenase
MNKDLVAMSVLRYQPIGVMAVLGPFNLPAHLPNGHIVPALLAGNTVVFKPSEKTPAVGQKMIEFLEKAGVPAGVVNLIHGAKEPAESLITNDKIDGVLFTGSYNVGKSIHKLLAGKPEKMLALEMGGNNPLVIWDFKDLKTAAYLAIQSAFVTSGQRCVCARKLIIPDSDYGNKLLSVICEMTKRIKFGDPSDEDEPFMGPVISKEAADQVFKEYQFFESCKDIDVLVEMIRDPNMPALLSPGIIDVSKVAPHLKNMVLKDEEVFGPLLKVYKVKTFSEAVAEANNTKYGLAASILTDDSVGENSLGMIFLKECSRKTGIVNINKQTTGALSSRPFGGVGYSGNHRASGYFAGDYCSFPVSSIEDVNPVIPENIPPGLEI